MPAVVPQHSRKSNKRSVCFRTRQNVGSLSSIPVTWSRVIFCLYLVAYTVLQQSSLSYKLVLRFLAGLMRFNNVRTAVPLSGEPPDSSPPFTPEPYSVNIKQPQLFFLPPLFRITPVQPFFIFFSFLCQFLPLFRRRHLVTKISKPWTRLPCQVSICKNWN